jgi:hypothetical protein
LGGLLAVLNTVLYVSAEERTERAIKKIYGETKEYSVILDENVECGSYGYVDKIFLVKGESENKFDYLFHSTGKGGYKDGSITYWIKVQSLDGKLSVENMLIESNDKQSFIGSVTADWHAKLYGAIGSDSKMVTTWSSTADKNPELYEHIPTTGATNSKNASCNAVNCIVFYLQNFELGGANEN